MRTAGRQRTTELALTGRTVTAQEFKKWGVCNRVCEKGNDVVVEALEMAKMIVENSPDAVIVIREGLKMGWESLDGWSRKIYDTENMQEGLNAPTRKRATRWKESRL